MKLFYEQVMRRFAKRGRCEIHLLRLDGRPIAGQYTLMTDDTVYILKIGYDQAFATCRPASCSWTTFSGDRRAIPPSSASTLPPTCRG